MHSKYVQNMLSAETSGYLDLEHLASQIEQAIISKDLDSIRDLLAQEKKLTARVSELSRRREEVTQSLCLEIGCTQPSLQKLAACCPEKERRELLQARGKLLSSAEAARDRNRRNSLLLASSLKIFKGMLAILYETVDAGVYSAPGTVSSSQPGQVTFDLKI